MTLADKARACADAAPRHQSADVLRECADALDVKDADLAALRAAVYPNAREAVCYDVLAREHRERAIFGEIAQRHLAALRAAVMGLQEYKHTAKCRGFGSQGAGGCTMSCTCYTDSANAALAAAKKMAGGEK